MKNGNAPLQLLMYCFLVYSCATVGVLRAQTDRMLSDKVDTEIAYTNSVLRPNENIDQKIQQNLFVKAFFNKNTCTVGEPILVTYLLYTRLNSQSKVATQPTFSGCTVYELTSGDTLPRIVQLGALYYKTYEIRKVIIVPLRDGSLTLDAAVVDNAIDFYSPLALKQNALPDIHKQVLITSNKPTLQVLPLPKQGAANSFNGGVGNFTIRAGVTKRNDTVNSNNRLEITISGQGNFASVELPTIKWPTSIHYFEHGTATEINTNDYPIAGKVVFTVPFSTTKTGTIHIPPIIYTFFDPALQQYKTIQTEPIEIQVTEAGVNEQQVTIGQENTISPRKYIWIVPLLALIVMVVMLLRRNKQIPKKEPTSTEIEPVSHIQHQDHPTLASLQQLQEQITILIQAPNINDAWYKQAIAVAENWQLMSPSATAQTIITQANEALYAPVSDNFHQSIVALLVQLRQ